jgi:hypothetical protein
VADLFRWKRSRLRRGMMRKHALANPSRPMMPAELSLEKRCGKRRLP